jgi:hypothetical protein
MAQQAGDLRWHSARASIAAPRRGERLDRRAPWRPLDAVVLVAKLILASTAIATAIENKWPR